MTSPRAPWRIAAPLALLGLALVAPSAPVQAADPVVSVLSAVEPAEAEVLEEAA